MPWKEALFKGKKVWVEVSDAGAPVAVGGRTPMRYSDKEGATIYGAGVANVAIGAGEARELPAGKSADDSGKGASGGGRASGRGSGFGKAGTRTATQAAAANAAAKDLVQTFRSDAAVCFTDGACKGNPGPAGAGAVVRLPDGTLLERAQACGIATNNVGELTAIDVALDLLDEAGFHPGAPVEILTDSKYSHGVLALGWKAKANQNLIAGIKDRLEKRKVRLHWIAGHVGIPENERADALANEGVAVSTRR